MVKLNPSGLFLDERIHILGLDPPSHKFARATGQNCWSREGAAEKGSSPISMWLLAVGDQPLSVLQINLYSLPGSHGASSTLKAQRGKKPQTTWPMITAGTKSELGSAAASASFLEVCQNRTFFTKRGNVLFFFSSSCSVLNYRFSEPHRLYAHCQHPAALYSRVFLAKYQTSLE